jgi:hypothetical protein
MKIKRNIIISILVGVMIFLFYFFNSSFAQSETSTDTLVKELMQQGKIRTCLKSEFVSGTPQDGENSGVKRITQVHLNGKCASPTGCYCVMSWGENSAVANREEFEECSTNKDELEKEVPLNVINRADKIRNRAIHCGHGRADLKNSFLASLKPGSRICNIIKYNSQSPSEIILKENKGYLPYGPVDVVVEEETYRHTPSDFAAVGDLPTTVSSEKLGQGGAIIPDNEKTQKLGEINFTTEDFNKSVDNIKTNCVSISWDPYGRVFDSQSLEPISEVYITLIDNLTKKPAVQQFNFNDDVTGEDGLFNILVEKEGWYQLKVEPLTNHEFVTSPKLSPYWNKIYSDLYSPNEIFQEKVGVATHHDIALQSKGTPYRGAIAQVVNGTLKSELIGDYVVYMGRVTFPMGLVCLVEEGNNKQVGQCVNANNIGNFTIAINKAQVPSNRLIIKVKKVDLNNPNLYKSDQKVETIHANSLSIETDKPKIYSFEPILNHVEGFVYDNNGQIVPQADVLIRLKINNQLFYQTKADDSGFFIIYTNNLPYVEYYFEFINPKTGKKIVKTTSKFFSDNKIYLTNNKINMMTGTKFNQPIINPKTGKLNNINKNIPTTSKTNGKILESGIKTTLAVIVFVLIVLVIITVGVILYIKRK